MRVDERTGFVALRPTAKQHNRLTRDLNHDSEAVRLDIERHAERQKREREERLLSAEARFDADAYGNELTGYSHNDMPTVTTEVVF